MNRIHKIKNLLTIRTPVVFTLLVAFLLSVFATTFSSKVATADFVSGGGGGNTYSEEELASMASAYTQYRLLQGCAGSFKDTKNAAVGGGRTIWYYVNLSDTSRTVDADVAGQKTIEVKDESGGTTPCNILKIADNISSDAKSKIISTIKTLGNKDGNIGDCGDSKCPIEIADSDAKQSKENFNTLIDQGDYSGINITANTVSSIITDAKISEPYMTKASWYVLWQERLNHCGKVVQQNLDSDNSVKMPLYVDGEWKAVDGKIEYNSNMSASSKVTLYANESQTCTQIADGVNDNIDAYIDNLNAYAELHQDDSNQPNEGDTTNLVEQGGESSTNDEDPCQAGLLGFGWIFCPGANLIEQFLNGFLNSTKGAMEWTFLVNHSDEIMGRWQQFLSIANIAFAIAFMVMIYSMATSTGLSNYDIKKMLPRLIVVAIAVNISFYICGALVDLSNIAGQGVYDLLSGGKSTWDGSIGLNDLLTNGILTAVTIIGIVFVFGISAIIALMIIYACITVRQVALVVLIVISPIAFACYLLPNTQKWFRQWLNMFTKLLLVYPMYMAVWGAAVWISGFANDDGSGINGSMPALIVRAICYVAPALAIIPLFKMSGGIMGTVAARAAGSRAAAKGRAAQSYMRGKGTSLAKNNFATRAATRRFSTTAGKFGAKHIDSQHPNTIRGMVAGGISHWAGRKALQAANATGKHADTIDSEIRALDSTAMDQAKSSLSGMNNNDIQSIALTGETADGKQVDQYMRRAAMEQYAGSMDHEKVGNMLVDVAQKASALDSNGQHREAQALREAAYNAAISSKSALVSNGDLQKFRNGAWSAAGAQAQYDKAVSNYAGKLSADKVASLSGDKHEFLQEKLASGGSANNANLANYRDAAAAALNNERLAGSMNASTRSAIANGASMHTSSENSLSTEVNNLRNAQQQAVTANDQAAQQAVDEAINRLGDRILSDNQTMYDFQHISPSDQAFVDRETLRVTNSRSGSQPIDRASNQPTNNHQPIVHEGTYEMSRGEPSTPPTSNRFGGGN